MNTLLAISDATLLVLTNVVCGTVIVVVQLITKKSVDENTTLTKAKTDALQEQLTQAATHAKMARAVGVKTLEATMSNVEKTQETAKKVEELQAESGLLKRSHIMGDEPTPKEKP